MPEPTEKPSNQFRPLAAAVSPIQATAKLRRLLVSTLVLVASTLVVGCAGPRVQGPTWPTANVMPAEPPQGLDLEAPTSMLRRGPDGLTYIVGGFGDREIQRGDEFIARYSGDWPIERLDRPAIAAGRVVEVFGNEAALVHLTYQLPDTDASGLEIDWDSKPTNVGVGKGLAAVEGIASADDGQHEIASLKVPNPESLQSGDVYALLQTPDRNGPNARLQLAQRLAAVCVVRNIDEKRAECHLYRTRKGRGASPDVDAGQTAVFLEHHLQSKPSPGVIQVASVKGANEPKELRKELIGTLRRHVESTTASNARVTSLNRSFDATDRAFHRRQFDVEYTGKAQIVVGLSVAERNGRPHLIANYTGVGPASGPGMVAAPPTGGVSLGPVGNLNDNKINSFAVIAWSGLMVYRGQTHQAMLQLHYLLSHPYLTGPMRWHARDQYAMRWAALGFVEEALWLVQQDEAIARKDDDREARLNAMGTRVRLYEMLERPALALELARTYLEARRESRPSSDWMSAVGMLAEMLAANEQYDAVSDRIDVLTEACPEGCNGDLFVFLANVFWSVPVDARPDLKDRLIEQLLALGESAGGARFADARFYQGYLLLGRQEFDQALIGFLEAGRIYKSLGHTPGRANALYFQMLTHGARESYQKAYDSGEQALELQRQLRDFESMTRTLRRLSGLFSNIADRQPRPYFRKARPTLAKAFSAQLAAGRLGEAASVMQTMGQFLLKFGHSEQVKQRLQQSVTLAVPATRFDVAATSHFLLAMVARRQQNRRAFQREIQLARMMAKLSGDEQLQQAIEKALNPESSKDSSDPTQLL